MIEPKSPGADDGTQDTGSPEKRSNKGRPKRDDTAGQGVHDALLAAAEECFQTEQTSRVPVRRIAAKAGVNQAMINYYFTNKDGLLVALFESNFLPLVKKLREFEKKCAAPGGTNTELEDLVVIIDDHFRNNPSLFSVTPDVLDKTTDLNNEYNNRIGSRGYQSIARVIQLLMDKGLCRTDISAQHAAYFICCICALPYLISPIFHAAFNGLTDGARSAEVSRAAAQLLKVPAKA